MGLFDYILPPNYEYYLNVDSEYDSRIAPRGLIKQLQNLANLKKFLKNIHKPTSNSNKVIRRLHTCHLLLLYSDIFANDFATQLNIPLSEDKWLNDEFVKPYMQFLHKCSNSYELYSQCCKSYIREKEIFDQLFFIINLLKLLFKSTHKISLIGKFYKSKSPKVWQGVIQMIAIQGKQLYFTFKNILTRILQDTEKYLFTPQLQQIMKNILIDDLAAINEDMKHLLLGKEFFPYGKAIGIKLFRIDEATTQLENTMRGIVTDHCETNRRLEKQHIEKKLFNKNGFNVKFFEETLGGGVRSEELFRGFGKQKDKFKTVSEQVVVSDEQNQDPEETGKKLPQTNQSNLNKMSNV